MGRVVKPNIVVSNIKVSYPLGINYGVALYNVGVAVEKLGIEENIVREADLSVDLDTKSYSVKFRIDYGNDSETILNYESKDGEFMSFEDLYE